LGGELFRLIYLWLRQRKVWCLQFPIEAHFYLPYVGEVKVHFQLKWHHRMVIWIATISWFHQTVKFFSKTRQHWLQFCRGWSIFILRKSNQFLFPLQLRFFVPAVLRMVNLRELQFRLIHTSEKLKSLRLPVVLLWCQFLFLHQFRF
jgi:hypothetical protein